jgi:hypothetical protein
MTRWEKEDYYAEPLLEKMKSKYKEFDSRVTLDTFNSSSVASAWLLSVLGSIRALRVSPKLCKSQNVMIFSILSESSFVEVVPAAPVGGTTPEAQSFWASFDPFSNLGFDDDWSKI